MNDVSGIGNVENIPVYYDNRISFLQYKEKKILIGKYYNKLSKQSQDCLLHKKIDNFRKKTKKEILNFNKEYKKTLKEMYTVLQSENKQIEPNDEMLALSDEYISLTHEIEK